GRCGRRLRREGRCDPPEHRPRRILRVNHAGRECSGRPRRVAGGGRGDRRHAAGHREGVRGRDCGAEPGRRHRRPRGADRRRAGVADRQELAGPGGRLVRRGRPVDGFTRYDPSRIIRAPRGSTITCKSWQTEAALRMLMNNLDPEVAERPAELVVYGGIGRAARNWECFDKLVEVLRRLGDDETLLVQSGKPVGVFQTHPDAPRVLLANSNLVPRWASWEQFHELDRRGLMIYGQMTAGSWIYIGSQGIVQGTYETFAAVAKKHFGGS